MDARRATSQQEFAAALRRVVSPEETIPLNELTAVIPRADELALDDASPFVLIRTDLDVPVKNDQVVDETRLVVAKPVIEHFLDRGRTAVLFGHIGRTPDASLRPVCVAIEEVLGMEVRFVEDWVDEEANGPSSELRAALEVGSGPSLVVLENARKYWFERALWTADPDELEALVPRLFQLAMRLRDVLSPIEVNESIAASNLDFSSSVLPLVMSQTGMGFFMHREFKEQMPEVLNTDFVVFSGLKMDKLDDLERMLDRRNLRTVFVGGALAMPLLKARASLSGTEFSAGRAERDPDFKGYVSPERIEQGKRIVQTCERLDVGLFLPVDFVLDDGAVGTDIPSDRLQMDVGPETVKHFTSLVTRYVEEARQGRAAGVVFYNGVFGKFEEERFSNGTKAAVHLLGQMTAAGLRTYVGGGEGRLALLRHGSVSDVTHAFTAGGTVLKCLSDRPIGYMKAMYHQNVAAGRGRGSSPESG